MTQHYNDNKKKTINAKWQGTLISNLLYILVKIKTWLKLKHWQFISRIRKIDRKKRNFLKEGNNYKLDIL